VRVGIQILLGLPFAEVDGIVTDINETFSATQIRVLIQDASDSTVTRSYFIPRNANFEEDGISMIADNPLTTVPYAVGDTIDQFSPLSKGVELLDWVNDPSWWAGYQGQGRGSRWTSSSASCAARTSTSSTSPTWSSPSTS
jgi:hypothetical protein